jgi:hypothetical protein
MIARTANQSMLCLFSRACEQTDYSQRGEPRICRVWSAHECAPAWAQAPCTVQPRPASSPRLGYPMQVHAPKYATDRESVGMTRKG